MLTDEFVQSFIDAWVLAWNSNNLQDCANWIDENALATSTNISKMFPDSNGTIKGKNTLLKYFSIVFAKRPDLKLLYESHAVKENVIYLKSNHLINGIEQLVGYEIGPNGKVIRFLAAITEL